MKDITLRLSQHLGAGDADLGLVVEHIALAGKSIARQISRARLISARYPGSMMADVELAEDFVAGRSPEATA